MLLILYFNIFTPIFLVFKCLLYFILHKNFGEFPPVNVSSFELSFPVTITAIYSSLSEVSSLEGGGGDIM